MATCLDRLLPVITVLVVLLCALPALLAALFHSCLFWLLWIAVLPGCVVFAEAVADTIDRGSSAA